MKRAISLIVCVAVMLTLCLSATAPLAVSAADPGLLSDFENEVYNGFYWNHNSYGILGNATTPASVEMEENGNHYLFMPAGDKNYNRYYQGLSVKAGTKYCLRLRYKGAGCTIQIQSCAEGGGYQYLKTASEWTEVSLIFTFAETIAQGSNYILSFWNTAPGGVGACIDDVYLNEVVTAEGMTFAEGENITLAKGETKQLTPKALPEGASLYETVKYQSDNQTAVTVSDTGVIKAVAAGVATITATADGLTARCTVTVDPYAPILLGNFDGELESGWTSGSAAYGIIHSGSPMKVVKDGDTDNYCLAIPPLPKADGTGNDVYYRTFQNAPLSAGKTYRITLKYKGSGGQLYLLSNGVATGSGLFAMDSTAGWKTLTKVFTVKTPANISFSIGFRHTGAASTCYVDDVYLEEVTPFDNQIVDGDFETEVLSDQWSQYTASSQVAVVEDTIDGDTCMRFDGTIWLYMQKLDSVTANTSYKVSFKLRGKGKFIVYLHTSDAGSQKGYGLPAGDITTSGKYVYFNTKSDEEWVDCSFTFRNSATVNAGYTLSFGGYNSAGTYMYLDDISMVELGNAYVQEGLVGGSLSLTAGDTTAAILPDLNDGNTASTVKVNVENKNGYVLVPGSLRYITSEGFVKRILNKDAGEFGEGAGNTFAFDAPNENVRVVADFVSTTDTDFAFGTVGTSVHVNDEGVQDGIRFLNRVQLTSFDENANSYTFTYKGDEYAVEEIGLLLKRADVHYELDLEVYSQVTHDAGGTVKMWNVAAYKSQTNTFRAVDYTDTYIDFAISLVTNNPDEDFCERLYTARSYVVLKKDGVKTVVYGSTRTDSVDTATARANGLLSDDITAEDSNAGNDVDPSTPIPDDNFDNADLKILNIGNSYGHNSTSYIADVATASGKTVKVVNLFKSGCTYEQHYNGLQNNLPQYWYELNGVIDWSSAVTLKAALLSDDWDIVTMNGMPGTTLDTYQPYLSDIAKFIKKNCPDAKFYFTQIWAYADNYQYLNDKTGKTRDEMWSKVLPAAEAAAAETGFSVIPCGHAVMEMEDWFEANRPELSVYQADGSHIEETWGWYLLALVWYRTLTGEEPANTFTAFDKAYDNDPVVREMVYEIAMSAVDQYYPAT